SCDSSLPATGVRDDVLIVVNDNSLDSCEVGRYYAEKRGLGQNNIVHIAAPALYWLSWDEFRNMMDQLIAHMQQPHLLTAGAPPAPSCTDGTSPYYCQASMDHLRAYTKLRYLVMTRGVPTRSPIGGSTLWFPTETTSIDNYLAYWLVRYFPDNNNDGFSDDVVLNFREREIAFKDGRGMRTVDPVQDAELIVGRIDGLNLDATKRLIDRIIDSENNGVYGKHYGSAFGALSGRAQWLDYRTNKLVYGSASSGANADSWHYQYGIVGEDRQECVDYLNFSSSNANGKAPQDCKVKFAGTTPGVASSRAPIADDALVYFGSLQGQSSGRGSFSTMKNWVRNPSCTVKLCENATDPLACRASSTDALKEFATDCVGVGDGFIGYNYQSFPVSYMASWPTAWPGPSGGSSNYMAFPEVREDVGYDDNFSLWFRNTDTVGTPMCYAGSDFSNPPSQACTDQRRVNVYQYINFAAQAVDQVNPQQYQLSFRYKANGITEGDNVKVRLRAYEPTTRSWVDYGNTTVGTFAVGETDWSLAQLTLTLDPVLHTSADLLFSRIELFVNTGNYTGELAFDAFSMTQTGVGTEMLRNTSFNEGHKEVSGGDHAAMYLSRLNGVGFWGSSSHHQSGGHSFSSNPQETLLYFYRGLPLGDAVWWGETFNSGLFYGDPIYSPVAVRLDYVNDYDYINGLVELSGSAVNGRDTSLVTTNYSIDYCPGDDFYDCDRNTTWQPSGISGSGGQENVSFGTWDSNALTPGPYTLRLTINSDNPSKGRNQSYYDYYPVVVYDPAGDDDGDGLSNGDELDYYATNPMASDTDGDTISDPDEINIHGTNPLLKDTDSDGMSDNWEITNGLQPTVDDSAGDLDSDGLSNVTEFQKLTDPQNVDTDGDGLTDGDEVNIYNTNPRQTDSDFDGLSDGDEVAAGTDPSLNDTDGDGMKDGYEVNNGLDPLLDDSALDPDADGLSNLNESIANSDPHNPDTDGDGLNDGEEVNLHGTMANRADTDIDGLTDSEEINIYGTDPLSKIDSDLDGMSNDWESVRGTDPLVDDADQDPDDDQADNIIEYLRGTLPLDASSIPATVMIHVDLSNVSGVEDGTAANPYSDLTVALNIAQDGDTIQLASGVYSLGFYIFNKALRIVGPADRSAEISMTSFFSFGSFWTNFNNLTLRYPGSYLSNIRNVHFNNSHLIPGTTTTIAGNSKLTFRNCLLSNTTATSGIAIQASSVVELINSTVAGMPVGIDMQSATAGLLMHNSILSNTVDLQGVSDGAGFSYNLISDGQFIGINGNISGSIDFVDAANGDYHLLPGSLGIDAGDPVDDFSGEPENNGDRINMGAYGNTAEAAIGADADGDGLTDQNEQCFDGDCSTYNPFDAATNPTGEDLDMSKADTDGDGFIDLEEVSNGGNPLDVTSLPLAFTSAPINTAETGFAYNYTATTTWTGVNFSLVAGPTGMSVDPVTGEVSWLPAFIDEGDHSVALQATLGAYSVTQMYTLSVNAGNTGDLNNDGRVDVADLVLVQRMVLGLVVPTIEQRVRG
ncbi:MAG: hypothetical protein WBN37_11000, partial [Arenicellales bacterium]